MNCSGTFVSKRQIDKTLRFFGSRVAFTLRKVGIAARQNERRWLNDGCEVKILSTRPRSGESPLDCLANKVFCIEYSGNIKPVWISNTIIVKPVYLLLSREDLSLPWLVYKKISPKKPHEELNNNINFSLSKRKMFLTLLRSKYFITEIESSPWLAIWTQQLCAQNTIFTLVTDIFISGLYNFRNFTILTTY